MKGVPMELLAIILLLVGVLLHFNRVVYALCNAWEAFWLRRDDERGNEEIDKAA
jgi:hypothetical protein